MAADLRKLFPRLEELAEKHSKEQHDRFQYGTAGFRTDAGRLDSVLFRVGVLAGLRSKRLEGKYVGVMVTASHNPEDDNGVKLVDPRGDMLEASWETYATNLANAETTDDFIAVIEVIVKEHIRIDQPANVVYARDTRPSGTHLIAAFQDGLLAIGARGRDEGITTTPILHYLVRCINTKGTNESYGEDSVDGYFKKMSSAFKKLVAKKAKPPPLLVDCANGVGSIALKKLGEYLGPALDFIPANTSINTRGALNHLCGADFVKTNQRLPPSLTNELKPNQWACSVDGDADRVIYYYIDDRGNFRLLDGDKIAALVAGFIVDLIKGTGIDNKEVYIGVVQTAYANGHSTAYLKKRLPVKCVPTGVKYLHHAAERFPIGVYFEANGHGTVLFSPSTLEALKAYQPNTPAQATCLNYLMNVIDLINQTVGDALSDMLLVEAVLAHKSYGAFEWDSTYTDLPNRLVKVAVRNRAEFRTEDAERRLVTPWGMQARVDETVRKYDEGRAFVRPSGTEDVVRVYAEATDRAHADELAFKIAGIVYDDAGGDQRSRPKEFI